MLVELEQLIQLQKLDSEIAALTKRLGEIPKEKRALQKEVADEQARLKAAEDDLAAAEKQHRENEGALESAESKTEKYKEQLMNVKSNEEYRAMQKQIEQAKAEIGQFEDKILHGMDAIEELKKVKRTRSDELTVGQKEIGEQEAVLDKEHKHLKTEKAERDTAREELKAKIPEETLGTYTRVCSARGGIGVAEAIDERCQACMVRFRPQMFQELRNGDKIMQCGSCQRILYYLPESQATAG